jgi:hypothetical protein
MLTSDPGSVRDVPVWARATGNRLVEQTQGIIGGIKVDTGTTALAGFGGEKITQAPRAGGPGGRPGGGAGPPGTLEVLRPLGVTPALLDRGDRAARLQLHLDGRHLAMPFPDIDADVTSYPFVLVSARQSWRRR